jgi:hypothetical protein
MVNRNHGSNFEQHGVAFAENAPDNARHDMPTVDDEKLSDVRSDDNEKA